MNLPPADVLTARQNRVRSAIGGASLDALVVVHLPNVRHLTGFGGSAAIAVVTAADLALITDGRYVTEVQQTLVPNCPGLRLVPVTSSYDGTLADLLASLGPVRVGVEASHMTVGRHAWLSERLAAQASPCRLAPVDRLCESGRLVKDAFEVDVFRRAAALLDAVAVKVLAAVRPGQLERDLAAEIDYLLKRGGFERPSFDTIVASGPNAALPHARPGERALQPGDPVILDFGGVLDGYCVDMTRTVAIGPPGDWLAGAFSAVLDAHQRACARVAPGVKASDVDEAARAVLEARGLGAAFSHSTGHGLGLEIHEEPRVGPIRPGTGAQQMSRDEVLAPGMVLTVEPGVYVPGHGGVRVEDDVLVTAGGGEVLTRAPRELHVVRT